MPKLSIIVPVYNVAAYLPYCLQTLRCQSEPDIEIICVDDGSTDQSAMIAQMSAEVDSRIKIVSKLNGGLSSARNAGLAQAKADIVWFVDSDDAVSPRAAQTILEKFAETNADIVTFGADIQPAHLNKGWLRRALTPHDALYESFHPELLFQMGARPYVWRSAFKRDFLLRCDLLFDEHVPFGEDQVFYFQAYPLADRVATMADKLYVYRAARPDSLMANHFGKRKKMLVEHQHIAAVILDYWQERGWLDTYRGEMFGWIAEFLGEDALGAKGDFGQKLRSGLRDLIRCYFPKGEWLNRIPASLKGVYAAVSGSDSFANRFIGRSKRILWRAEQEPLPTALEMYAKLTNNFAAQKAKGVASRIFPAPAKTQYKHTVQILDEISSASDRVQALEMLRCEWEARQHVK